MTTTVHEADSPSVRIASALLEIEVGDPSKRSRIVLWTVVALFAALIVWATLAKVDIVAVAQGRLVPQTYVKIVQPAEAGVIREILVKEGDAVESGQILVRLDPTVNSVDSTAVVRELQLERLQLRRIEAELASRAMSRQGNDDEVMFLQVQAQGISHRQTFLDSIAQETAARERAIRELDAAREIRAKLESTLPSYEKTAAAYEKLAQENLIGTLQAEERRREASEKARDLKAQSATVASLEATITERDQRIAQLKSAFQSALNQERLESVASINRLEQQRGKLTYQEGLLELRAPQTGIVKDLATTTVGAVVQPGAVILSLVPADEPLRADVQIQNQDIGFVRAGQSVRIKLAAFQFQKYGMLEGTVETVSADSTLNERSPGMNQSSSQDMSFKALIRLQDQKLAAEGLDLPLAAGMQVSAEIVQGKRTILEYLMSPVQRVMSEAAMER